MEQIWHKLEGRRAFFLEFLGAFFLLALGELFFFRGTLSGESSFSSLFSDNVDAQLNFAFLEHWYQMLLGQRPWSAFADLQMYSPVADTFAFSDLLLAFVPFYSFFRLVGADIFAAGTWAVVGVHFFGSLCLYYFCRNKLKVNWLFSVLAIVASNFSCTYAGLIGSGFVQLVAFSLLPLWFIVASRLWQAWQEAGTADVGSRKLVFNGWGVALSLYTAIIAATSFYTFFFLLLWITIWLLVSLAFYFKSNSLALSLILDKWGLQLKEGLGYLLLLAIALAPLAYFYGSAYASLGKRSWDTVAMSLIFPYELALVPEDQWLYGFRTSEFFAQTGSLDVYLCCGLPLISLLLFAWLSLYWFLPNLKLSLTLKSSWPLWLGRSFVLSLWLLILCTLRFGDFSLWKIVYWLVPGAGVIRFVSRLNVFVLFPLSIFLVCNLQKLWQKIRGDYRQSSWQSFLAEVGICLAVFLVFADNFKYSGVDTCWNLSLERLYIKKSAPVPPSAKLIYAYDSRILHLPPSLASSNSESVLSRRLAEDNLRNPYRLRASGRSQLETYFLAQHYRLPTLNGYTGNWPEGYYMTNMRTPGYLAQVEDWCRRQGIDIKGLYAYDVASNTWHPHRDLSAYFGLYWYGTSDFSFVGPSQCRPGFGAQPVPAGAVLVGPGCYLSAGSWQLTVFGENLQQASFYASNYQGGVMSQLSVKVLSSSWEKAILQVNLQQDCPVCFLHIANEKGVKLAFRCLVVKQ